MKPEKYKMFFLVNRYLSDIQKGIQCGHAALEFSNKFTEHLEYKHFINHDKTWVILDGGISNSDKDEQGTMENHLNYLNKYGINNSYFCESSLNNTLTAICFLVPQIVFDRKIVLNFPDWIRTDENVITNYNVDRRLKMVEHHYNNELHDDIKEDYEKCYNVWCNKLGGHKYGILRDFINQFKTA